MKVLISVASQTGTSITELRKMDIFEFFAALAVVEEKIKKK
jgi:hypothetical protein